MLVGWVKLLVWLCFLELVFYLVCGVVPNGPPYIPGEKPRRFFFYFLKNAAVLDICSCGFMLSFPSLFRASLAIVKSFSALSKGHWLPLVTYPPKSERFFTFRWDFIYIHMWPAATRVLFRERKRESTGRRFDVRFLGLDDVNVTWNTGLEISFFLVFFIRRVFDCVHLSKTYKWKYRI